MPCSLRVPPPPSLSPPSPLRPAWQSGGGSGDSVGGTRRLQGTNPAPSSVWRRRSAARATVTAALRRHLRRSSQRRLAAHLPGGSRTFSPFSGRDRERGIEGEREVNVREFRGKERRDDKVGSLSLFGRALVTEPPFVARSVGRHRRHRGLPGRRHLACWRVPPRRRRRRRRWLWGGWVGGGVAMGPGDVALAHKVFSPGMRSPTARITNQMHVDT